MRKQKTLLYVGLGLAAWWYYQKSKGNNIFGQPAASVTASTNAALAAAANASPAALAQLAAAGA